METLLAQDVFVYDLAVDVKNSNSIVDVQTRTDFILPNLDFHLKSVNKKTGKTASVQQANWVNEMSQSEWLSVVLDTE